MTNNIWSNSAGHSDCSDDPNYFKMIRKTFNFGDNL